MDANRVVPDEEGFTLIEVVVAMFLLAGLSMGLLPVMIQGITQSTSNVTLATATQLANKQIDLAQSKGTTCSLVKAVAGAGSPVTDSRGRVLTATTTAQGKTDSSIACPVAISAYPTTVTITVAVTRAGVVAPLATASTLVYVDAP